MSKDAASVTRQLEDLEQELAAAWKTGNCEAWGAIVAPEWSVVHITGDVMTRAQALEMCRNPEVTFDSMTIDDVSVRSFTDAAVVTGRTTVIIGGATPETVQLRFTDVFIHRDGRWQVVASHATRLA